MPKLSLMFEGKTVKEVPIGNRPITICRSLDNDLPVDNLAVSNHHARVYYEGARLVHFCDIALHPDCLVDAGEGVVQPGEPLQHDGTAEIGLRHFRLEFDRPIIGGKRFLRAAGF